MKPKFVIMAAALLLVATAWSQNELPRALTASASRNGVSRSSLAATPSASMPVRNGNMRMAPQPQRGAEGSFEARLQDMQETLTQMHVLLKQMQASSGGKKDQAAMDNIRLWQLMLAHLDKTLAQARQTAIERALMYRKSMAGQPGASALPAAPK